MLHPLSTSIDSQPCARFAKMLEMDGGHHQAERCVHRQGICQLSCNAIMADLFCLSIDC